MDACAGCTVGGRAICRSLDEKGKAKLGDFQRRQRLQPGQTLLWEGDDSLLVGNVVAGVLKQSVCDAQGSEQTVGLAYAGDFIGRPFGARAAHSVIALTEAEVCTFRRAEFDAFARERPAVEHELLERALGDLDHARRWMVLLARKSAGARTAAFLLEMADRAEVQGCGSAAAFDLCFGRQEIADVLGLTIETVSRQFTELRNQGIIATPSPRRVIVLDRALLMARSEPN